MRAGRALMEDGQQQLRVLLVEDSAPVRERVSGLLRAGTDLEVIEVETVADALAHLRRDTYDAVLLDLGLPDGSGLRVLSELRHHPVRPMVVVLTASPDLEVRNRCFQLGADGFYDKGREVIDAVRAVTALGRAVTRPSNVIAVSEHPGSVLRQAIDQCDETVLVTDARGYVEYVNPAFERTTGFERADVLGRHIRVLKSGAHDEAFYRTMWTTLLAGETWRGEFVNRKKDGTLYRESAVISPVRGPSGQVVRYVAVKRDLSREDELFGLLVKAQRMDSLGGVTASVAHDFNNILSSIVGLGELIRPHLSAGTDPAEHLGQLLERARMAATLVEQLLDALRKQPGVPTVTDLRTLLASDESLLLRTIGRNVELVIELAEEPLHVHLDGARFEQVLMNLVINAVDAMPHGGRLHVAARREQLDAARALSHGHLAAGEWVSVEVRDHGTGMTAEVFGRLFEPLFTTKAPGKGTGLGLATVRGIVEQAGGAVHVDSAPGEGTAFKLYFPRVSSEVRT